MSPKTSLWRIVRCRVLRLHHWRGYGTDDGGRYVACSVCRREHSGRDPVHGMGAGGAVGGGGVG